MRKNILLQLPLVCLLAISFLQKSFAQDTLAQASIYDIPVTGINDAAIDLQQYAGKKICFVIVPAVTGSVYSQVQSFCNTHADPSNMVIIGIPSKEDGYTDAAKDSVQQLYAGLPIILTEGMYTRKSAGAGQGELLQWLTDVGRNRHFDNDAAGAGQLFFVGEVGKLYAVLNDGCSLDADFLNMMVHMEVSAELQAEEPTEQPSNP